MNLFRTLAIFVVEMLTIERLNKKKKKERGRSKKPVTRSTLLATSKANLEEPQI